MVEFGASFSADAGGEDAGSPGSRAANDGQSHVDARAGRGMPGQGAGGGYPSNGRAGRKRIVSETESRNEVSPGYFAGSLRRKRDCLRVSAQGRGRELLRAPGAAIGSAAGGRARRCGVPADCAISGGMPAEVRGGAGDGALRVGRVCFTGTSDTFNEIVIPSQARDLQSAAKCRSLAWPGMTKSRELSVD